MPAPVPQGGARFRQPALAATALLWVGVARAQAVPSVQAVPELRRGPYLVDVGDTHVTVMVELSGAAAITVRSRRTDEPSSSARTTAREASDLHAVVLSSLSPATRYVYVVESGGERAGGTFRTAPRAGEAPRAGARPLRFALYGDNRTNATPHAAVVRAIRRWHPDLLLHTGDMVEDGADAREWQDFFDVERDLLRDTPLLAALGNHELGGGGASDPAQWDRFLPAAGGSPHPSRYWVTSYGHVRILGLDSNDDFADGEQLRWLESELRLARSREGARLVFAVVHHGPFSSGWHGDNDAMRARGVTALLARGVDLVVSGHDHIYERGEWQGLKFVVTGGAGAPLYPYLRSRPFTEAFEAVNHFVGLTIDDRRVGLDALRADGSLIERCSFTGRGGWQCARHVVPPDRVAEARLRGERIVIVVVVVAVLVAAGTAAWRRSRGAREKRGRGAGRES